MINPWKRIEVNHYTLCHPGVDANAQGARLAHITDIHMGRWVKPRHVEALARYVNAHAPDLAVLTGDYVGYNKRDIARCAASLRLLQAPAFATLGNHDHWASADMCHRAFEQAGIELLANQARRVRSPQGHQFWLVGVDDAFTRNHDVEQAFEPVSGDGFRLVLSHVPELGPELDRKGADLILSGHTHGLQFNIPGVAAPLAARFGMEYITGAYPMDDGGLLYVSRGLGSASWPWRYRASPELAFFTLEHASAPELILERREVTSLEGHRRWRRGRTPVV